MPLALLSAPPVPAKELDRLRVLVVDDDAKGRGAIGRFIEGLGHDVDYAASGVEGLQLYLKRPAQLVIADWFMPGLDGLELAARIRDRSADGRYVYIILVSGVVDRTNQIAALTGGADDLLSKPIDLDELEARIVVAKRVTAAHRRLFVANRLLRHEGRRALAAARTDPLTGAWNRRQLDVDLDALARGIDRGASGALAMIDVDEFKAYNDAVGHLAGDHVLSRIVRAAAAGLRRGDDLYRYGGEEFVALLHDVDARTAERAMLRFVESVRELAIAHPKSPYGVVTVSVGVAPGPATSADAWIVRADAALYRAKRSGKNRVELADDG